MSEQEGTESVVISFYILVHETYDMAFFEKTIDLPTWLVRHMVTHWGSENPQLWIDLEVNKQITLTPDDDVCPSLNLATMMWMFSFDGPTIFPKMHDPEKHVSEIVFSAVADGWKCIEWDLPYERPDGV